MELKVTEKPKRKIDIGDIVVFKNSNDNTPYLIIKENGTYTAKHLNGHSGATGNYNSLEGLIESFNRHTVIHYSKNEYSLELVKK